MSIGSARRHFTAFYCLALACALVVAACGGEGSAGAANQAAGDMTAPAGDPGGPGGPGGPSSGGEVPAPPDGAIKVGDDLYMVPIGTDKAGCDQFTAWSVTKAVPFIIYYRDKKGGFTADRGQADCRKT